MVRHIVCHVVCHDEQRFEVPQHMSPPGNSDVGLTTQATISARKPDLGARVLHLGVCSARLWH